MGKKPLRKLTDAQRKVFQTCFISPADAEDFVSEEAWTAAVEMAESDANFRAFCARLQSVDGHIARARLQQICRSAEAKIACIEALRGAG